MALLRLWHTLRRGRRWEVGTVDHMIAPLASSFVMAVVNRAWGSVEGFSETVTV